MRKLIIGFSKSNGILGRIIRMVQDTPFNHVVVIDEEGSVAQADLGGVTYCNSGGPLNYICQFAIEVSERRYLEVVNFLKQQVGKKYQIMTLFAILFDLKLREDGEKSYICSELVARAMYKELGFKTPQDVLDATDLKDIYKRVQTWIRVNNVKLIINT